MNLCEVGQTLCEDINRNNDKSDAYHTTSTDFRFNNHVNGCNVCKNYFIMHQKILQELVDALDGIEDLPTDHEDLLSQRRLLNDEC